MYKNIFKSMFAVLFMYAALSSVSYSQDGKGSPEEKATEWATWLNNKVSLTGTQYDQVYGIYLKYAQQYKADREKKSGKHKGGYEPYRKKANSEIKPLLTEEQLGKWKGKKSKH